MLNEHMENKLNEEEKNRKFSIKKDGFDIEFLFTYINYWKLEKVLIEKPSSNQEISAYPFIRDGFLHKMYVNDSFGSCRKINRYDLTKENYPDFLIDILKEHSTKVKDNLYEDNAVMIYDNERISMHFMYDSQEKSFIMDFPQRIKNTTNPKSIIFNLELSKLLSDLAYSAYNAFMSEIKEHDIKDVQLRDIDIDLSELSSWFDKERCEFNGYGYLIKEMKKNNRAIITTRDIAEADIKRNIDSTNLEQVADNISQKTISGEENPGGTDQR